MDRPALPRLPEPPKLAHGQLLGALKRHAVRCDARLQLVWGASSRRASPLRGAASDCAVQRHAPPASRPFRGRHRRPRETRVLRCMRHPSVLCPASTRALPWRCPSQACLHRAWPCSRRPATVQRMASAAQLAVERKTWLACRAWACTQCILCRGKTGTCPSNYAAQRRRNSARLGERRTSIPSRTPIWRLKRCPPPPNRRAWGILSRPVSSVDAAAELSTQHADILAADGGARPRSLVWLESSDAK